MADLITGASSGLGHWLASVAFPGSHRFNRQTGKPDHPPPPGGYDLIIHTAQATRPAEDETEEVYIHSHAKLTRHLRNLPHRRFIYLSSIDAASPATPYARCKQAQEAQLTGTSHPPATIIRPAALFGPGMRPNGALRVALSSPQPLTLSAASTFAFTAYEDVATAIHHAGDLPSCFSLASLPPYTLSQVAEAFGTEPAFGSFTYTTGGISVPQAVLQAIPALQRPALERLQRFVASKGYQS